LWGLSRGTGILPVSGRGILSLIPQS